MDAAKPDERRHLRKTDFLVQVVLHIAGHLPELPIGETPARGQFHECPYGRMTAHQLNAQKVDGLLDEEAGR
jgi:hypothetical protein